MDYSMQRSIESDRRIMRSCPAARAARLMARRRWRRLVGHPLRGLDGDLRTTLAWHVEVRVPHSDLQMPTPPILSEPTRGMVVAVDLYPPAAGPEAAFTIRVSATTREIAARLGRRALERHGFTVLAAAARPATGR